MWITSKSWIQTMYGLFMLHMLVYNMLCDACHHYMGFKLYHMPYNVTIIGTYKKEKTKRLMETDRRHRVASVTIIWKKKEE